MTPLIRRLLCLSLLALAVPAAAGVPDFDHLAPIGRGRPAGTYAAATDSSLRVAVSLISGRNEQGADLNKMSMNITNYGFIGNLQRSHALHGIPDRHRARAPRARRAVDRRHRGRPRIIPNGAGVDHWFWNRLQPTSTPVPVSITYTAPLNNIVTTAGNYSMKLNLRGETAFGHHTKVYVNNTQVKDFTWSGQVERTENITNISPTLFINGNNSIKIEEILDAGVTVDRIYTNWFEITYNDSMWRRQMNCSSKARAPATFLLASAISRAATSCSLTLPLR